jgi:hypothetical protein
MAHGSSKEWFAVVALRRSLVACAVAACIAVTGACSASEDTSSSSEGAEVNQEPTTSIAPPPAPATQTAAPSGQVAEFPAIDAMTRVGDRIAVLTGGRTELRLIENIDSAADAQTLTLPSPAKQMSAGRDDRLFLALDHAIGVVDLDNPNLAEGFASYNIDRDNVSSVVELPDSRIVAGAGNGDILVIDQAGDVKSTIAGLSSADELIIAGGTVVALDKPQTSLTEINLDSGGFGLSLRAGSGATQMVTDHYGRILVSNTPAKEILVYTAGQLVLHQRFPVGAEPYALAYDDATDRLWVSFPALGQVASYDLSSGTGVEDQRFDTVRQPNSLVIDPATGGLLVGSADGAGLQLIDIG